MKILVTGAAHGLGAALADILEVHGHDVIRYDIEFHPDEDVTKPSLNEKLAACHRNGLDVLVNCAGINRIGWLQEFSLEQFDKVMAVNAKGIFNMTQALARPLKASKGAVLNIVSNAAHVPMRCSAAYNASKGAALMLTKQLARELAPDITVFSVSPNKLSGTRMSADIDRQVCHTRGWTPQQARQYQLAGLLPGVETPVEAVADFIAFLLSTKERHRYLAGADLPYGS